MTDKLEYSSTQTRTYLDARHPAPDVVDAVCVGGRDEDLAADVKRLDQRWRRHVVKHQQAVSEPFVGERQAEQVGSLAHRAWLVILGETKRDYKRTGHVSTVA